MPGSLREMKGLTCQVDARSWNPEESTTNWEQGSPVEESPEQKGRERSAVRGDQVVANPQLGGVTIRTS